MDKCVVFIKTKEDLIKYMKEYQKKYKKNPFFTIGINECIFQDGSKIKNFSRNRS